MNQPNPNLSIQDIKLLMSDMSRNHITRLRLEQEGFTLELESASAPSAVPAAPAPQAQPAPAESREADPPPLPGTVVTSPIVGTFYAAPSPDRDAYVQVGSAVKKGDVLFIIESMKLMNEVLSEVDGTVTRILVENEQGVEYGEPILCIE